MPTVAWPRRSLTTFGWTFAPRRSVACVCRSFIQFPTRSMPWSLFWPVVAWAAWRRVFVAHGDPERARAWRFLLAWVGVMFIFFSISAGKRELYMVPAMPAGALLTADALLVLLAQGSAVPRWWTAGPSSRPPRRAPASRSSSTHASLTSTFRDCSASSSSRSRRRRRSRGGGSDASELPRSDNRSAGEHTRLSEVGLW